MGKILLLITTALSISACGFRVVDTGFRGIETRFGQVVGEPLSEGLHFYNPFTSSIAKIDVREQKLQGKTECFTRDTQVVTITYVVNYYPNKEDIHKLYQQFGEDYAEKIINQKILGSIKDSVGQYIADRLDCITLVNLGFSRAEVSRSYNVSKSTIEKLMKKVNKGEVII